MADLRKIKEELVQLDLAKLIRRQLEELQDGQFVETTASSSPRICVVSQAQDGLSFLQLLEQPEASWSALLDLLLPKADAVAFTAGSCIRFDLGTEAVAWQWTPPDALQRHLKAVEPTPGHTGMIYTFELSSEVRIFLRSVPRLSDWHTVWQLPEDPALSAKAQPLLRSISHENLVWAKLTTADLQALQRLGIFVEFTAHG